MTCYRRTLFIAIAFISTILFSSNTLQLVSAKRPLRGEDGIKNKALLIQSLQAGPVPPSGSSPCSHIPGTGICINEKNYAGPFVHPPPSYPGAVIDSAAASMAAGETKKQDSSS